VSLPAWAVRAFEEFQPDPGNEVDDPDANRALEAVRARFENRWRDLAPDRWHVPAQAPFYARVLEGLSIPADQYVRSCILEVAVECALENQSRPRQSVNRKAPPAIRQAVTELSRLNDEISHGAGQLAALFRAREMLMKTYHLGDGAQQSREETLPDAFDLAGALKRTLEQQRFGSASYRHRAGLDSLYEALRSNYRQRPTLADLLDEVSARTPMRAIARRAPDLVELAATKTKSTEWSVLQRQLVEGLATWGGLPSGFLVRCLDTSQLATLCEVTFCAPAEAFSDDQTRKLLMRMDWPPYQSGRFKPRKRPESS
jgi:hypothetical protein